MHLLSVRSDLLDFFSKKRVLDQSRVGESSFNTSPFGPVRCVGLLFEEKGAGLVSGGRVLFKCISFRSEPVCWTFIGPVGLANVYRALTPLWFLVSSLFLFVVLFVSPSLCVLFWGSSKSIPCSLLFLWFLASSLFLFVSLCCSLRFSFSLCSPGALLNRYRALSFSFVFCCSRCFSLCPLLGHL